MVPGARAQYEKTTQKNFADAFLLEDASQEVSTDSLILNGTDSSGTDAGFRLLSERDVDDAADLLTIKLVGVLNSNAPWIIFQERSHQK